MSGVAVIFRRDGAPVAAADLEAMTAAMGHRAVDGVRHELDGPLGVGFCSMVTTPSALHERQPQRCRGGSTIVAMDGRIDDRRTLLAASDEASTVTPATPATPPCSPPLSSDGAPGSSTTSSATSPSWWPTWRSGG